MSTQPPVPVGETSVDSVGVPNQGVVSRVEGAPISTAEVPQAATQGLSAEDHCRVQFVATATLTWNTAMLPGTILYRAKIHPDSCGEIVRYIRRLYNVWGGSIEYQMKIAGTGFHAGALGMARIPPNVDVTKLNTLEQITIFPYKIFDPKIAEPSTVSLSDQRRFHYHYTAETSSDKDAIGGWFIIFVHMPLATSSTGLNQINIQLWTKLGEDFQWDQVMPPSLNSDGIISANPYDLLFPKKVESLDPMFRMKINSIQINLPEPKVTLGLYGMTGLNGKSEYPYASHLGLVASKFGNTLEDPMVDQEGNARTTRPYAAKYGMVEIANHGYGGETGGFFIQGGASDRDTTENLPMSNDSRLQPGLKFPIPYTYQSEGGIMVLDTIPSGDVEPDVPNPVVYNGESVVRFGAIVNATYKASGKRMIDNKCYCCQTYNMIQALTHVIEPSTSGMAAKFIMTEKETGLPVMYLKLYPEGFFTTTPVSQVTYMTWDRYEVAFDSFMSKTDVIVDPKMRQENQQMKRTFMMLKSSGML